MQPNCSNDAATNNTMIHYFLKNERRVFMPEVLLALHAQREGPEFGATIVRSETLSTFNAQLLRRYFDEYNHGDRHVISKITRILGDCLKITIRNEFGIEFVDSAAEKVIYTYFYTMAKFEIARLVLRICTNNRITFTLTYKQSDSQNAGAYYLREITE